MSVVCYFDLIPYETVYSILLDLPYRSIMSFCLSNHEYYQIWNDNNFWSNKAHNELYHIEYKNNQKIEKAVTYQEFNQSKLKSHLRYLELLARVGNKCEQGSEQCIDINKCLFLAAKNNDLILVKYFIAKDVYQSKNLISCLQYASFNGNLQMVEYLLTIIKQRSQLTYYPIEEALKCTSAGGHLDLFDHLLKLYLSLNVKRDYSSLLQKSLNNACQGGHIKLANYLFNLGKSLNINYDLNTILLSSSYIGNEVILDSLILKAKELNLILNLDEALNNICYHGYYQLIEYFVAIGAKSLNRAILAASESGNLNTVKYIIDHSLDLKLKYCHIIIPTIKELNMTLYVATLWNRLEIVKYLTIHCKLNISVSLEIAHRHKYIDIISYLNTLI